MAKYKYNSIAELFQKQANKYSGRTCVSYKKDGIYTDISWSDMNVMVHNLAYYMLSLGIKKGDKIGLFSPNRYEWWVADLAILSIGAVNVPIYATNSAEEAMYILKNSESKLCFAGTAEHLDKVLKVKKSIPKVKNFIIFDELAKKKTSVLSLKDCYVKGEAYKAKNNFDKRMNAIKITDLATIIYTSGTTGDPKGVMLNHNNFISNLTNINKVIGKHINEDELFLSFLPLSHSLERTAGYYLPIFLGAKVAFAEEVSTLMENFVELRPTIVISVPRIYEKVHSGIVGKVAEAPFIRKAIFNWAMGLAKKNLPYECKNKPRAGLFAKQYDLADKLVFSKLRAKLGMDRLKYAISGGGPLSVSDAEFFIGMGIMILEGFGLSETTPVTNVNLPGNVKPGTVGPAIPETKIKIADDGELLIKGPQVMEGYYKNPKATREAFTKDKFFKSGDIGVLDSEGYLTITGRIKDIIVTAGGKNISPQNIENSVKGSRFIEQIAIIGDKRKYLSALIIPNMDELKAWAEKNGVIYSSNDDLISGNEVNTLIKAEINKFTEKYSRVEQIKTFRIMEAEWTQETGELTPTQKIKRKVISKMYAAEIDALYPEE